MNRINIFLIISCAFFTSCEWNPFTTKQPTKILPNKDEVAVIDGRGIRLTDYFKLKDSLPELTKEELVWVLVATTEVQAHAKLTSENSFLVSLFAINKISGLNAQSAVTQAFNGAFLTPKAAHEKITTWITLSKIIYNKQFLAKED